MTTGTSREVLCRINAPYVHAHDMWDFRFLYIVMLVLLIETNLKFHNK